MFGKVGRPKSYSNILHLGVMFPMNIKDPHLGIQMRTLSTGTGWFITISKWIHKARYTPTKWRLSWTYSVKYLVCSTQSLKYNCSFCRPS